MENSHQGDYAAQDGQQVRLEAHLGDGIVGNIVVYVGAQEIFSGPSTPPGGLLLGSGAGLRGQVVQVLGRGRQILPSASWASLRIRLTGGPQDQDIVLRENPGDRDASTLLSRIRVVAP